MKSIGDYYPELVERLANVSQTPRLDAQVLLAHVIKKGRAWVLAHPEAALAEPEMVLLDQAITRLAKGEPLPYILGEWEFYGLKFHLSPAVLIPRPETELLVEQGLVWLRSHPGSHLAADIGTGSGCIAVALAKNHPSLEVIASDISRAALEIAGANIRRHNLEAQIELVQADLIPPAVADFSLICANLPYIPAKTLSHLKIHRWEPETALHGGPDGLELIRRLITQAPRVLAATSLLLLEIESQHGETVSNLVSIAFPKARIELLTDLAGNDRMVRVESRPDQL